VGASNALSGVSGSPVSIRSMVSDMEERLPQENAESGLTGKMELELELLQRHVEILKAVKDHEPIGIIRLSEITGHPQHKVRYSLRILEQEGLIEPSAQGAVTTAHINEFIPHLRNILNMMTETVAELRKTIGA
jgi:predicted transcriptional regulator